MSNKIKTKNKDLRQNHRGKTRKSAKALGYKRSDLEQGTLHYRGYSKTKTMTHKANAYQERKRKNASRSKRSNPFQDLGHLFS